MALRMRAAIVSLCALLAACQTGPQLSSYDYPGELERATRFIERGRFDDAIPLLNTLTDVAPEQPVAWQLLAGVHMLRDNPAKAQQTFTQGLDATSGATAPSSDLALQAALLCSDYPELSCDPQLPLTRLADNDPRRQLVQAVTLEKHGEHLAALKTLIGLLKLQLPKGMIAEVYLRAAQIYQQMNEPMYVNESLFHAVNFSQDPILMQRIEKIWEPQH